MEDLSRWKPCGAITNARLDGRLITILPFDAEKHGKSLWRAFGGLKTNELLRYFSWKDFDDADDLAKLLDDLNGNGTLSTCVFACAGTGKTVGMASYMRTDEANGVTEIGCIAHSPLMARSAMATEAHYLLARRVFEEAGYRRYEWKCHNDNDASKQAARRLGFTFEGVFRQHIISRGANRDTAWFSMIDSEWPLLKQAFQAWLDPRNYDADHRQIRRLQDIRETLHARET